MWRSMSITGKILLALSILVCGYSLTIGYGLFMGIDNNLRLGELSRTIFPASRISQNAFDLFEEQVKTYKDMVATGDIRLLPRTQEEAALLIKDLESLRELTRSERQKRDIAETLQRFREFNAGAQIVYVNMRKSPGEYNATTIENAARLATQTAVLRSDLKRYRDSFVHRLDTEVVSVGNSIWRQAYMSLLVFVLGVAFSLVVVMFIVMRSIRAPLKKTIKAFSTGAMGDFSTRLDEESADEVGQLAHYFNTFMEKLELYNRDLHAEILEHQRSEEALRVSRERYLSLFENAMEGIFQTTLDGKFILVNPAMSEILGYESPQELLSSVTNIGAQVYADPSERELLIRMMLIEGRIVGHELSLVGKGGTRIRVILNFRVVRDTDGQPDHIEGSCIDITSKWIAEKDQKDIEEKFAKAFQDSPVMMAISATPGGEYIEVNNFMLETLGYQREEMLGKTSVELGILEARVVERISSELQKSSSVHNFEIQFHTRRGMTRTGLVTGEIFTLRGQRFLIMLCNDITELKLVEEDKKKLQSLLSQAQKMESIGTLAGGIAHDFNNILSSILGYGELAKMKLETKDDIRKDLEGIITAGIRASDLVKQILTFSRQADILRTPILLPPMIKETLKFLRSSLPSTIEIKQDIAASSAWVMADPTQIHQVMMNLCTNAHHAMKEEGGILGIVLKEVVFDESPETSLKGLKEGRYLQLSISDTGHGIPAEIRDRIFDPFFTTKERGEGTGLGLAMVHGIVKDMEGAISVYSEPGAGTAFNIYLPVYKEEAEENEAPQAVFRKGHGRILFVDDEEQILASGKGILEKLGYEVVTAASSLDALQIFISCSQEFDLVLTDMTMPNMTGLALSEKFKEIRPDIPVVLCTGFALGISDERLRKAGIRQLVMKPMVPVELAETVFNVLNPGGASDQK